MQQQNMPSSLERKPAAPLTTVGEPGYEAASLWTHEGKGQLVDPLLKVFLIPALIISSVGQRHDTNETETSSVSRSDRSSVAAVTTKPTKVYVLLPFSLVHTCTSIFLSYFAVPSGAENLGLSSGLIRSPIRQERPQASSNFTPFTNRATMPIALVMCTNATSCDAQLLLAMWNFPAPGCISYPRFAPSGGRKHNFSVEQASCYWGWALRKRSSFVGMPVFLMHVV